VFKPFVMLDHEQQPPPSVEEASAFAEDALMGVPQKGWLAGVFGGLGGKGKG